mmetsp:Transcript_35967/g.74775  ORF Transcript_35967/g.74775 Transcript_35967/m.74775 type:complete len:277 (-) Transcript_35967:403-1233(-)
MSRICLIFLFRFFLLIRVLRCLRIGIGSFLRIKFPHGIGKFLTGFGNDARLFANLRARGGSLQTQLHHTGRVFRHISIGDLSNVHFQSAGGRSQTPCGHEGTGLLNIVIHDELRFLTVLVQNGQGKHVIGILLIVFHHGNAILSKGQHFLVIPPDIRGVTLFKFFHLATNFSRFFGYLETDVFFFLLRIQQAPRGMGFPKGFLPLHQIPITGGFPQHADHFLLRRVGCFRGFDFSNQKGGRIGIARNIFQFRRRTTVRTVIEAIRIVLIQMHGDQL